MVVKSVDGGHDGARFCRMGAAEYRERLLGGEFDVPVKTRRGGQRVKRVDYEESLHMSCFDWIFANERSYPDLLWVFHSPNGGYRTKAQAGRFKAMGVRAGVVDIVSPFPSGGAKGLAIELKAPGMPPTPNQLLFLKCSARHGYVTGVCTCLEEFVVRARAYLGLCEIESNGANWSRWEK
jgi:hypothetical protein